MCTLSSKEVWLVTTLPQGLLGMTRSLMLRLSACSPLHGVQSAEDRAEGILEPTASGYTSRASWQQNDEGGIIHETSIVVLGYDRDRCFGGGARRLGWTPAKSWRV